MHRMSNLMFGIKTRASLILVWKSGTNAIVLNLANLGLHFWRYFLQNHRFLPFFITSIDV